MAPCAGGRFCSVCTKRVIDLTQRSNAEIRQYMEAFPDTCGRLRAEQLDPSLVPVSDVMVKARRGFFAALAALSLHGAMAQERVPSAPPLERPSVTVVEDPLLTPVPQKAGPGNVVRTNGNPVCPVKPRRPREKWYLTGRFPFLVRRKHINMGCPTF